jgi:5'-nucleotidase
LKILLTNDDGYDSDGLIELYKSLSESFDCYVVAPDRGRSCCGHAVTTGAPLEIKREAEQFWVVSGTPADCVRIGINYLQLSPDWVISGLNHGGNLGVDILYSGTVAAAREANLLGIPSMAVSQYMRRDIERDWTVNAERAVHVIAEALRLDQESTAFWNLNLPAIPPKMRQMDFPISLCRPDLEPFDFEWDEVEVEEGGTNAATSNTMVIYKSNYQNRPRHVGSDVDLCFRGHATISKIRGLSF